MNTIPEDALVTPTVELFANDMRLESIRSEMGEWIAGAGGPLCDFWGSDWTQLGLAVLAFALGVVVSRNVVQSMCPAPSKWRWVLGCWFCACSYVGVTKVGSILSRSGSDDGVTLTSAECGVTNGYSFVQAKATGGDPNPMWYREAASNDWTLATDDGWTAATDDHTGAVYTREWRNSSTNEETVTHAMWYFGENPPAVELTASGGVQIVSALFSGKLVRFAWYVPVEIPLPEGSSITLQNYFFGDLPPAWSDAQALPVNHATNETIVTGFFLDRKSAWRIRLEVPR